MSEDVTTQDPIPGDLIEYQEISDFEYALSRFGLPPMGGKTRSVYFAELREHWKEKKPSLEVQKILLGLLRWSITKFKAEEAIGPGWKTVDTHFDPLEWRQPKKGTTFPFMYGLGYTTPEVDIQIRYNCVFTIPGTVKAEHYTNSMKEIASAVETAESVARIWGDWSGRVVDKHTALEKILKAAPKTCGLTIEDSTCQEVLQDHNWHVGDEIIYYSGESDFGTPYRVVVHVGSEHVDLSIDGIYSLDVADTMSVAIDLAMELSEELK